MQCHYLLTADEGCSFVVHRRELFTFAHQQSNLHKKNLQEAGVRITTVLHMVNVLHICDGVRWCVEYGFFIEPSVKISGDYCRNVLCRQHLISAICRVLGEFFTF